MKLNLACGNTKIPEYVNIDVSAQCNPDVVMDVLRFPWPWASHSIEAINCAHFIEHIPHLIDGYKKEGFFLFFEECWRVMKNEGQMTILFPVGWSQPAFGDPTHTRFLAPVSFCYLDAGWRKKNGLDHYNVNCDFEIVMNEARIDPIFMREFATEEQKKDYMGFAVEYVWNAVPEAKIVLACIKPIRKDA